MRRHRILVLSVVLTALAAAPAQAADYSGSVSAASPSFTWAGGPGTGYGFNVPGLGGVSSGFFGCMDGVADCEESLIEVKDAGKLTVTATADDQSTDAIDLYLYPSNAAGEFDDAEDDLAEGAGATVAADEKIEIQAAPGFYMAQVRFFDAQAVTYKGGAVLSGFAAPAPEAPAEAPTTTTPPPPPPTTTQAPPPTSTEQSAAAKRKAAVAKCKKKAKKIKNKKKRKKALKRCAKKR